MIVEEAIVLIDRGQGGVANLAEAGIRAHSVFTLLTMLDYLVENGRMQEATAADVRAFLSRK
jgi:uridine monophosphate synthetase